MHDIKEIIQSLFSWQLIIIVAIIAFRRPLEKNIERFIKSDSGKAKFGHVEIELGKLAEQGQQAVENMNKIT